jgi:hypothetical protein
MSMGMDMTIMVIVVSRGAFGARDEVMAVVMVVVVAMSAVIMVIVG